MKQTITQEIEIAAKAFWMETGKHPELVRINPELKQKAELESPNRFNGNHLCGWEYVEDNLVSSFKIE